MTRLRRHKNRLVSRIAGRVPALADRLVASYTPRATAGVPWTPFDTPLETARIAIVTTAGVHHRRQRPFDMLDARGDPGYRVLDRDTIMNDYVITHDYYDHRDADRDLNVVFPLDRLNEAAAAGLVGASARKHYGFMGHILGHRIDELRERYAPELAAELTAGGVDAVLLTPG